MTSAVRLVVAPQAGAWQAALHCQNGSVQAESRMRQAALEVQVASLLRGSVVAKTQAAAVLLARWWSLSSP